MSLNAIVIGRRPWVGHPVATPRGLSGSVPSSPARPLWEAGLRPFLLRTAGPFLLLFLLGLHPGRADAAIGLPTVEPVEGFGLVEPFPGLMFEEPVGMASPPGMTNQLFVVERRGRIQVITNLAAPTKTLFLDLKDGLWDSSIEGGLLGLAFHPGYATNRHFFVYRTETVSTREAGRTQHFVVSRFETSADDPYQAIRDSEVVFLAQADRTDSHNAGDLQFGPDGYLYISTGEHGPGLSPAQNLTRIDSGLFGILRIDVDRRPGNLSPNPHPASTANYAIPADNPFIGRTEYLGEPVDPLQVCTELYAIGFRNPWRIHWDAESGDFFAADVGQSTHEEINLVTRGGNYGWPYREGAYSHAFPEPLGFEPTLPLWSGERGWNPDQAECVIGGVVYRGQRFPELQGAYLFGGFRSGHLMALRHDGNRVTELRHLTGIRAGLSSFATDPRDREVLLAHVFEGRLYKLVFQDKEAGIQAPRRLSELGAFANLATLEPAPGLIPYEINAPFWSDNAIKQRFFSLPADGRRIQVDGNNGPWTFPAGMVWVKHFDIELTKGDPATARRLETRFLMKTEAGIYGLTYRWLSDNSDAILVEPNGEDETLSILDQGVPRTQVWHYPSRHECAQCHSSWGGWALGFSAEQLNRESGSAQGRAHQLDAWNKAGYFSPALTDPFEQRKLAHINDESYPLGYRVRSYLQSNCSQCHLNPGPSLVYWDARMSTPLEDAGIVNGHVVAPRDPAISWLLARIGTSRTNTVMRMPPIASAVVDTNAVGKIRDWISLLPPSPWVYGDIGTPLMPGTSSVTTNEVFSLSGGGRKSSSVDSGHFLGKTVDHAGLQILAHISSTTLTSSVARAGLMIRDSLDPLAGFGAVFLRGDGLVTFERRSATGSVARATIVSAHGAASWLRLVKSGTRISGYWSANGTNWIQISGADVPLSGTPLVGMAVNSGSASELHQATFDQVSFLGASMVQPVTEVEVNQSQPLAVKVSVDHWGRGVDRAVLKSEQDDLGTVTNGYYGWSWQVPDPGFHPLTVEVTDEAGSGFTLPDVLVTVLPSRSAVASQSPVSLLGGHWKPALGTQGYWLAGEASEIPLTIFTTWQGGEPPLQQGLDSDPRALWNSDETGRIAASWSRFDEILLDLFVQDSALRRVTTYAVSWQQDGMQEVEWLDLDTGVSLGKWTMSGLAAGRTDTWLLRGSVRLRIRGLGGFPPVLSALFLDPGGNHAPYPSITSPANPSSFVLPAKVPIVADVQDLDGVVDHLELIVDDVVVATDRSAPWEFSWTNGLQGWHSVWLRAYDTLGDLRDSSPVFIQLLGPSNTAGFVGVDETTMGDWPERYGTEGWYLPNGQFELPPYIKLAFISGTVGDPGPVDGNPNWLLTPPEAKGTGVRIFSVPPGSTELPQPVEMDIISTDGRSHILSAYFYDPDGSAGPIVTLTDPDTGILLDTHGLSFDGGGRYLRWRFRGRIHISIGADRGTPYLSGLFVDPDFDEMPTVAMTRPEPGYTNTAPANVRLVANAQSYYGIRRVEFYDGTRKLGEVSDAPFALDWSRAPVGSHSIWARAVDKRGGVEDSSRVTVQILDQGFSEARFAGEDRQTSGFWIGRYGRDGWDIVNLGRNLPPYASLEGINFAPFTWNPHSEDPMGPLRPADYSHVLGTYYSTDDPVSLRVRIRDGGFHRVSLYLASYLGFEHSTIVQVWDSAGQRLLDTRTLASLTRPAYVSWDIRGSVEFRLLADDVPRSLNSVWFSGVFFDPGPGPLDDWLHDYFSAAELADPAVSGPEADPDGDGIPTIWEYGLGTDPRSFGSLSMPSYRIQDKTLVHSFTRSRVAAGLRAEIDVSSDLTQWYPPPPPQVQISSDDRWETITTRIAIPEEGGVQQFIRLRWWKD